MTPREAAPARRDRGAAEVVILLLFAMVVGFAFLWALVLHEKPPEDEEPPAALEAATTDTLVPPTLPKPREYEVDGGVNIRQGPATNTTVLGRLPDGAVVLVECRIEGQNVTTSEGSSSQWLRIALPGGVGFVSTVYVDTGDDIEDPTRIAPCV